MQSQCTVALQRNSLRVCASSYARLYSPEVAGAGADGEVDAAKPVGDDGDRTCGVLHLTARISSADAVCASLRCRAHTPGEHRTLTIPVSSSRLMKVTPCAVAGRCRCVTAPPPARGFRRAPPAAGRRARRRWRRGPPAGTWWDSCPVKCRWPTRPRGYPFVRVNCPTSVMPRRKKSAHPVR
jgi:hypothetical protein